MTAFDLPMDYYLFYSYSFHHFKHFIFEKIRCQYAKKDVMDDDILDALAVLWSAKRIQSNQASFLPQSPEKPNMQIVY